jgi:GGDEF domain-containing protein
LTKVARRLSSTPPSVVMVAGRVVEVGQSVGSVLVQPGEDLDAALHRADIAMYGAKRSSWTSPHR